MSDLSTTSWSEVDASNDQTPPEGWPAGMAPNQVEPTARMNMGAVKRFWNRVNPTYLAVLSTTDTYTVTETEALVGYGLRELRRTRFPSANITTSPTVNHSSLGAMTLVKYNNAGSLVNLGVGDIQAQDHQYWWDGTTHMVVTNPASVSLGTTNKASPSSSDSIVIADAAAGGAQKEALFSALAAIYPTKASPTSSDTILIGDQAVSGVTKQTPIGAAVGATLPVLSKITNSLGGDVSLSVQAQYFDGPSVAQGTVGTWFASGSICVLDTGAAATFVAKLWDGTTVIASASISTPATNARAQIALSGYITSPAGNIRISVADNTTTTGSMRFNLSGNSNDSIISAVRIA